MPITLALRIGISRLTMSEGHEHNKRIGMMIIFIIYHSSLIPLVTLDAYGPKMPHSVTHSDSHHKVRH